MGFSEFIALFLWTRIYALESFSSNLSLFESWPFNSLKLIEKKFLHLLAHRHSPIDPWVLPELRAPEHELFDNLPRFTVYHHFMMHTEFKFPIRPTEYWWTGWNKWRSFYAPGGFANIIGTLRTTCSYPSNEIFKFPTNINHRVISHYSKSRNNGQTDAFVREFLFRPLLLSYDVF